MMSEMLEMGTDTYSARLGLLLMNEQIMEEIVKEKGADFEQIKNLHPLEYLLQSADKDQMFLLELQNAFSTFIKEDILLLPKINAVLVGPMAEKRLITKENFDDFQTILKIQNRKEVPEPPPENESAIAKKMRLAREKREAVKRKQQEKESGKQDLADLLEIAEVFGIDYKNKSIYAFYGLLKRHQLKEKWTQDLQMLCAGASSEKIKAKYWGSNPED